MAIRSLSAPAGSQRIATPGKRTGSQWLLIQPKAPPRGGGAGAERLRGWETSREAMKNRISSHPLRPRFARPPPPPRGGGMRSGFDSTAQPANLISVPQRSLFPALTLSLTLLMIFNVPSSFFDLAKSTQDGCVLPYYFSYLMARRICLIFVSLS